MIIDVFRFFSIDQGIFQQRQVYYAVMEVIQENGFESVVHSDCITECVFSKGRKKYKYEDMIYHGFNKYGESGLDIKQIHMKEVIEEIMKVHELNSI